MSKNVVIALVVIIVLALAGWYLLKPQGQSGSQAPSEVTSTPVPSQSPTSSATDGAMIVKDENLVTISASGFTPKSITIKAGESVTWTNNDSEKHTVNSSPHPTHTDYQPLNLGVIQPGQQKSLTFDKAGTYKYHDHLNPSLFGSVTVE